ncbi:MAG: hypothetical protein J0H74_14190 [Chitinophagaceae bacterium]|nr:hypothetical protein [Chitinophagaceae bacterium]
MLEKDWQEIIDQSAPRENLKKALQALGLMVAYFLFSYIYVDLFFSKKVYRPILWVLFTLEILCCIGAVALAFIAFRGTIKSLRTQKKARNYLALILSVLILVIPLFWIIQFIYWKPWAHKTY